MTHLLLSSTCLCAQHFLKILFLFLMACTCEYVRSHVADVHGGCVQSLQRASDSLELKLQTNGSPAPDSNMGARDQLQYSARAASTRYFLVKERGTGTYFKLTFTQRLAPSATVTPQRIQSPSTFLLPPHPQENKLVSSSLSWLIVLQVCRLPEKPLIVRASSQSERGFHSVQGSIARAAAINSTRNEIRS